MSSSQAPTRRPRNSKLSAFYSLSKPSPSPSSPPPDAASDLIARSSLAGLLSSSARLRLRRDAAAVTQHAAVARVHAHTISAAQTASSARALADDARCAEGLAAARTVADAAADVDKVLSGARSEVDKLEDARKVELLRVAAGLLEDGIRAGYAEVVEMCLDPVGARERFTVDCVRFAALRPVFDACCDGGDGVLAGAIRGAQRVVADVKRDIAERMGDGGAGVEGMELLHIVRVRLLLGDEAAELKAMFLRASEMAVVEKRVSKEAAQAASATALSMAALEASFAAKETLVTLAETCETFFDMFVASEADEDVAASNMDDFSSWLAQVVETSVGERVRAGLEIGNSDRRSGGDAEGLTVYFADSVSPGIGAGGLPNASTGSGRSAGLFDGSIDCFGGVAQAQMFYGEVQSMRSLKCGETRAVKAAQFSEIMTSLCDDLCASAADSVSGRLRSSVMGRIGTILTRDYSVSNAGRLTSDINVLAAMLRHGEDSVDGLIEAVGGKRLALLDVIVEHIVRRVDDLEREGCHSSESFDVGTTFRVLLSGCVILDYIGNEDRASEIGIDVRQLRGHLLHLYCLHISAAMTEALVSTVGRLSVRTKHLIEQAPLVSEKVSAGGCQAVAIILQARRDAATILSATPHLQVAFGEGDGMLDDGGVLQRVCRGWILAVRNQTFTENCSLHSVQVDAAALDSAIGVKGAFDAVVAATAERQAGSSSSKLLSKAEVARRVSTTADLA